MLGQAKCNECGGTKTLEIKGEGEIWSRCLSCGFQECEWIFGDNPEYLQHLAQEYAITIDDIKQALKPTIKTPTLYQKTIIEQLQTLNPWFMQLYNVKAILPLEDGRTLRLHTRHRGDLVINIDITYDNGADLYNIKADKITEHLNVQEIFNEKGFYWDQLDETIHKLLNKHASVPLNYLEDE
jgi:hypothetical protein